MAKVSAKKLAIGAAVAAATGYLAGILTAPKSGRETRDDIKSAAATGVAEAEKQLKNGVNELGQLIDEAKLRGANLNDKASKELQDLATRGKEAREKAREVLTAIHDGDADDKDLKQAVQQAGSAVKHLREYLKK